MAGENVAANYGDLSGAVQQFNSEAAQFEQSLQNITRAVANLQSSWVGRGSDSFVAVMQQWNQDAIKINEVLKEIGDHVNQGSTAFQDTDAAIARGFNQFGG
jgi:WXG100 family type VII secretion target